MKYILMMQFHVAGWKEGNMANWKPEDIQKNMEFLTRLNQELAAAGELVSVEGLGGPEAMKMVRAQQGGAPLVTDGPFPEMKEFLAGFWIVDVDKPERAYELAARISALPGPGGKPANLPIEVRPVMARAAGEM